MWGAILSQLGKDDAMLPNYDAKAVAEVMGLVFVRAPKEGKAVQRRRRSVPDLVIRVDDATLLVVEANPDKSRLGSRPMSSPSPVFIEKAVASGLPRSALRHIAESIAGDDRAKVVTLEWEVVPKTTLERRETQLSPQESERTERIARLFVHARRALGTAAEAREFMVTPHPELDRRSPIEAARTDLGTRRAEQILNALEYGLAL
jgi:putative toxin-antitoxin system antitoxin component (TIGR02293 family)